MSHVLVEFKDRSMAVIPISNLDTKKPARGQQCVVYWKKCGRKKSSKHTATVLLTEST